MSSLQGSTSLTVIQIKKHKLPQLAFYMLSRDWAQAPRLGRQLPVLTELHPHLVFLYVPFIWGLRLVAVRDMGFSLSFLRDSPEGKGDSAVTGETGISLQLEKTELLQTQFQPTPPCFMSTYSHRAESYSQSYGLMYKSERNWISYEIREDYGSWLSGGSAEEQVSLFLTEVETKRDKE